MQWVCEKCSKELDITDAEAEDLQEYGWQLLCDECFDLSVGDE